MSSPPRTSPLAAAYQRWRIQGICALIAIVVAAVYWPVLNNGFVVYDDCDYVVNNPHMPGGLSLRNVVWAFTEHKRSCNWHPVTWLSHLLDSELYGSSPWGHHLSSLLLHAANSALLFLVFYRMTGAVGRSVVVAGLFGLHPMHVESVAWVAERKDVLSAFFFLATLLAYGEYVRALKSAAPARGFYGLALVFLALGLMSKPMVVTTPFVLLLLDYWPLGRLTLASARKRVVEKLPFFALTAVSSVITYVVQRQGGAMSLALNPLFRFVNAIAGYARYAGKLAWPVDLAAFYPYQLNWSLPAFLLAAASLLAITVGAIAFGRRRKYLPVGWFWFLGMLVPVIGVVQVGAQSIADRYSYLPSIGISIAVAWGVSDLFGRLPFARPMLAGAAALTGLACLGVTRRQIGYWKDGETLFRHALAVTEPNYFPHLNLGCELARRGQFEAAIAEDREALRFRPDCSEAHSDLGATYYQTGRLDEAMAELASAIRLKPDEAVPHRNLAAVYSKQGRKEDAIRELVEVVRLAPDAAPEQRLVGTGLADLGRLDEALPHLQAAVSLEPGIADWHSELAGILLKLGRADDAMREWETALRLNPTDVYARFNLDAALAGRAVKP